MLKSTPWRGLCSTAVDRQIYELQNGFHWAEIGSKRVVDIGGGSGHVSIALAQVSPFLA